MNIFLVSGASDLAKSGNSFFKRTYGDISVDSRYAGRFGWFWIKALKKLGHTVCSYPFVVGRMDDKMHFTQRVVSMVKGKNPVKLLLGKKFENGLISQLRKHKPDFILVDAGWNILPGSIKKISEKENIPIFNWLCDDPVAQNWKDVLRSFQFYDCIFVWDPYYIEEFKKHGAKKVVYLPCACDSDIHRTFPANSYYKSDVAFVGTITPSRSDLLEKISKFDLSIWTWNPGSLPNSLKKYYRGPAWGEKVSEIYSSSKIALNLHHAQTVFGANMKTFEIASCGAFQLVDYRREMQNLFRLGEELICYKNAKELMEAIEYYLIHEEERTEIACLAQKRAISEHTYEHRMKKVTEFYEGQGKF